MFFFSGNFFINSPNIPKFRVPNKTSCEIVARNNEIFRDEVAIFSPNNSMVGVPRIAFIVLRDISERTQLKFVPEGAEILAD